MRFRFVLIGAMAIIGLAAAPNAASAQCDYASPVLGLGGSLSGCFTATISAVGEDAGDVSNLWWFNGMPGLSGASGVGIYLNAPVSGGTFLYNDDCGSQGFGVFANCSGTGTATVGGPSNSARELVFGLAVTDGTYSPNAGWWSYSGSDQTRNGNPAPNGLQAVLLQVTSDATGHTFALGFEDLNTGCFQENPAVTTVTQSQVNERGVGAYLDGALHHCSASNGTGNSDADYNDFWVEITLGQGTRLSVTPEPMTMTLMATGLVGLAGAQIRRRRKNQG